MDGGLIVWIILDVLFFLILIGYILYLIMVPTPNRPRQVLKAPTNLSAVPRNNSNTVDVTWSPVAGANNYPWSVINNNNSVVQSGTAQQPQVTFSVPSPGSYLFKVKAANNNLTSRTTQTTFTVTSVSGPTVNSIEVTTVPNNIVLSITFNQAPDSIMAKVVNSVNLSAVATSTQMVSSLNWTAAFAQFPAGFFSSGSSYTAKVSGTTNGVVGPTFSQPFTF